MNWTFERVVTPVSIKIALSGGFCSRQFGELLNDLTSLEYWRFRTPLLFDARGLDLHGADPVELLAGASTFVNRSQNFAFTPIAIVFHTPAGLETVGRIGEIIEGRTLANVRLFLCEARAAEWLQARLPAFFRSP